MQKFHHVGLRSGSRNANNATQSSKPIQLQESELGIISRAPSQAFPITKKAGSPPNLTEISIGFEEGEEEVVDLEMGSKYIKKNPLEKMFGMQPEEAK